MSLVGSTLSASLFAHWLCAADDESSALPPVALIVAHPDDETVGAGTRLPRLREGLTLIYATDGAPRDLADANAAGCTSREDYAALRRAELEVALSLAGVGMDRTVYLGRVDQEASLDMPALTRSIVATLRGLAPAAILTHPYEGGHPDHDAVALAVHAACRLLRAAGGVAPALLEMTSYHIGPRGITTGEFLNGRSAPPAHTALLSPTERALKQSMLDRFVSQRGTLQYFSPDVERFRPAPAYDFTRPPHDGRLFYEYHPWGMDGARWRELARAALDQLGVPMP